MRGSVGDVCAYRRSILYFFPPAATFSASRCHTHVKCLLFSTGHVVFRLRGTGQHMRHGYSHAKHHPELERINRSGIYLVCGKLRNHRDHGKRHHLFVEHWRNHANDRGFPLRQYLLQCRCSKFRGLLEPCTDLRVGASGADAFSCRQSHGMSRIQCSA